MMRVVFATPSAFNVFYTPVVDNGSVYVGADNGLTYALQANTGVLRWYHLTKISN